jgi:CheY-like chemotaxis protein
MNNDFLILLTEDDEAAANLIQMNLKRAGVKHIKWAKNGQEALEYLRGEGKEEIHRIFMLLDINMPVLNGMETLKVIKSDTMLKVLPVVMLTTTDNPEEVEACYELGCNFYIKKPVDYKVFMATVREIASFANVCILPQVPKS